MSTSRNSVDLSPTASHRPESSPTKHSSIPTTPSSPLASSSPAVLPQLNLPLPPPPDRVPPPRGQHGRPALPASASTNGGRGKFKLLRKDKERTNSSSTTGSGTGSLVGAGGPSSIASDPVEDDEEWMLDESAVPIPPVERSDASEGMSDSFATEVPDLERREKERDKKGKGRSLVKKTSRLFGRGGQNASVTSEAHTLGAPVRQQSSASSDSQSTSNSRSHSTSASISRSSPPSRHSRRQSQDSQVSWAPSHSIRSGSISINADSDSLPYIPRRQNAHLSTSLPPLSRHSMPPPIPSAPNGASRQIETLPSRMSTWFSHLLPSSSTTTVDNPNPSIAESQQPQQPQQPPSPLRKGPSAAASFLNAARQKAVGGMRYLLDSEAQPDKCEDTMWVMGVGHPGWTPSTPGPSHDELPESEGSEAGSRRGSSSSARGSPAKEGVLRPSTWNSKRKDQSGASASPPKALGHLFTGSTQSLALSTSSPTKDDAKTESPGKKLKKEKEIIRWPEQFYDDFRSRVWCTYRAQYAPIVSLPQNLLLPTPEAYYSAFGPPADIMSCGGQSPIPSSKSSNSPWSWARSDERGLTSDAGWGCMLRTGQSMLANALIHHHLGRDWRLPQQKPIFEPETQAQLSQLESYATYVKVLSWFLDDPSPLCPFSVHRMALIGKELGKEVGEWFGPSTAAGALKTLANSFPISGVSVATAADSIIYKSDVFAASNIPNVGWEEGETGQRKLPMWRTSEWGKKAVLILIGIRLGLDGVNPIYHESVKALFTFPQSVGIAGGRPSSSYYFVASQANSLFYLDPHFTRPAVPLRTPPAQGVSTTPSTVLSSDTPPASTPVSSSGTGDDEAVVIDEMDIPVEAKYALDVVDVDELSSDGEMSSPSRRMGRSTTITQLGQITPPSASPSAPFEEPDTPSTPTAPRASSTMPPPALVEDAKQADTESILNSPTAPRNILPVDPQTAWYAQAYPEVQLRSFHCERVKKMPLSGLDPSMLLGFLCRDEADFDDFCARVARLPQKIFTVQDEPPVWDDNEDGGLESVSEPDLDDVDDGDEPASLHDEDGDGDGDATPELVPVRNGNTDRTLYDATAALGSFKLGGEPPALVSRPTITQETAASREAVGEGEVIEQDELQGEVVLIHSPSKKGQNLPGGKAGSVDEFDDE